MFYTVSHSWTRLGKSGKIKDNAPWIKFCLFWVRKYRIRNSTSLPMTNNSSSSAGKVFLFALLPWFTKKTYLHLGMPPQPLTGEGCGSCGIGVIQAGPRILEIVEPRPNYLTGVFMTWQSIVNSFCFSLSDRSNYFEKYTHSVGIGRGWINWSRTFSKSFLHYIMVTVKEIKNKKTREEQDCAKHKVLHKATLLSELGVQPGLTHLFGIHSEQDPF